jgi:hypothetical protein
MCSFSCHPLIFSKPRLDYSSQIEGNCNNLIIFASFLDTPKASEVFLRLFPKLKIVSISSMSICDISHRQNVEVFVWTFRAIWMFPQRLPGGNETSGCWISVYTKFPFASIFKSCENYTVFFRLEFTAYKLTCRTSHTHEIKKHFHNFCEHSFLPYWPSEFNP